MPDKQGTNRLPEDTIYASAAEAVLSVRGVNRLASTFAGNISKKFSGKDIAYDGVRLSGDRSSLVIDLYIIVDYGAKIPQLSWDVQKAVRERVHKNTGLLAEAVNVRVQGAALPRFPGIDEERP